MPEDFRTHFFNAPISARVLLNGKYLGDATIILSSDERVQLVDFTDTAESDYPDAERQTWLKQLQTFHPLGLCSKKCPDGLVALDYNLSNAQLNIVTNTSSEEARNTLWHALPEGGNNGLLLSSQFSATGGQAQSAALSWFGGAEAALGNWTGISQFQVDRSDTAGAQTNSTLTSLYLLRESRKTFFRTGIFMPDSQGILRQPYTRGGPQTLAGIMLGSSDTLMKDGGFPSRYPIWVTANREGVAEIYRDGALINSQPVSPGLQALDTLPLPAGVYEVEIIIREDGQETSRNIEIVNKPADWRDPEQKLRYNLFAGRQGMAPGKGNRETEKNLAAGASMNYLLRPGVIAGLALQKTGKERQTGASLDVELNRNIQLYANGWHSSLSGAGFDTQVLWAHAHGNVTLSHGQSRLWALEGQYGDATNRRVQKSRNTSLYSTYRLNSDHSLNGRIAHNKAGVGIDLGYSLRHSLADKPISWQFSVFDRPYQDTRESRNRGVSLSASFSFGKQGRSASASLGTRNDSRGQRDYYASASLSQQWENSFLKESSATLTGERHGAGLSTYNSFALPAATGSFWGQRSSLGGEISGGINIGSTLAFGQGNIALGPQGYAHQGGGMIVNVISDDPSAELVAHHETGSTPLKTGRNYIPVSAWKPGTVQIDFPGNDAPALKAWPQTLDYHHLRGGVSSHEVRVMKTVTLMGRLVDKNGRPLGGARVVNHAGRTVTEADGMFTLELHENNPVVAVEHHSGLACEIRLDPKNQKRDELIFAGNVSCGDNSLASQRSAKSGQTG
ncbi:hypothetical protein Y788_11450 [Pantoea dispersa 625]|nr:hypothetical protein Y788_11450 [Pantoea dispersa 625]